MSSLTPSALKKQIASGNLAPLYLIVGDDEAEKAELAAEFGEAIDEGLRAFNIDRFYGGEATLGTVLEAARTLPMMASRRVVIVLRAERMIVPKRETDSVLRELEAFERYLEQPYSHATVVFVTAGLDERRRTTKLLLGRAVLVRCGELEDLVDAERWIRVKTSAAGVQMDAAAVRLLAGLTGPNIGRLRGDLERLLLFAAGQPRVTSADVREVVGPASAHDDWGVTRAIERGEVASALRELGLALEAGAVPHMVLGQLGWVVRNRIPPAQAAAAAEALFRTDQDLKSSAGEPRVLLERLVVELCGAGAPASHPSADAALGAPAPPASRGR
jgi:DNA polymerase-3 subunit delta